MIPILLSFLCFIAAAETPLQSSLSAHDSLFFEFPRIKQLTKQMKAYAVISSTAINDRGLNVSATVSQTKSPELTQPQLSAVGAYQKAQTNLASSLTLDLRNAGVFNSTQLQLQGAWLSNDWQKSESSIEPVESAQDYSLTLSYDLIRGGYKDPVYLRNRAIEKNEFANLMIAAEQLVRNYLEYRFLLLDIYSSYCKLKTSKDDLEVIKKVLDEVKLSYELKTIPYKQYLNVRDTYNFIKRNSIIYELNHETFQQRLLFWSNKPLADWRSNYISAIKCPTERKQFTKFFVEKLQDPPRFENTIVGIQTRTAAEASKFQYLLNNQSVKPSIRPFVEVGQENRLGFDNKRLSVGVSFNWDTPSRKNTGEVLGSLYNAEASQIAVESNERNFEALLGTYLISFDRNKDLLELSIDSLENSDSLVKMLEIQKSIGQVDSLSISNAYTQRNNILNTIFDSMINVERINQEVYFLKNWKALIARTGIILK